MLESFDRVGCCLAKFRVHSLMFIVYLTLFHAGAIMLDHNQNSPRFVTKDRTGFALKIVSKDTRIFQYIARTAIARQLKGCSSSRKKEHI